MKLSIASQLIVLILASACARHEEIKREPFDGTNPFAANKEQILNKLNQDGTLEAIQTSAIDKDYEVVSTTIDTRYFLKDGKVVSWIRAPRENENKLIFWKYQFKGSLYRDRELSNKELDGHTVPMRQLSCDTCGGNQGGVGVVYDPVSEQVKRVYYYEKQ